MKDLKPRSIVLIVALACVTFIIGIVVAAPPENNPGQPFEQLEAKLDDAGTALLALEAKLDAIETKLDNVASQASVDALESKLDVIEPKLDSLESKLDSLND